ncbi:MAG: hypothetical protein ACYCY8_01200 [Burkholderiales bacterium]
MEEKPKKWMLPVAMIAVFIAILAAGYVMDHLPKVGESRLRGMLKDADDEQGRDTLKVRLPRIKDSEPNSASK